MINLSKRIITSELKEAKLGSNVVLAGWVEKYKHMGKVAFINLRDRGGYAQVVVPEGMDKPKEINRESVVAVKGKVKKSLAKAGGKELEANEIEIMSEAVTPLPIDFSGRIDTDLSKRLDHRYVDLRNPKNLLIFEITTHLLKAMRDYYVDNGYIEINTPKIIGAASESGAELFALPYFKKTAYLAQSPQFYKQMAMAAGFEKVFEIAPVFRANPSFTTRHDTEFTMVDFEISWINSHLDVMASEEKWVKNFMSKIKKEYGSKIKEIFGEEVVVPKVPFPKITMEEAQRLVKKNGGKITKMGDLNPENEKLIGRLIKKKYGGDFVFIIDYPIEVRPFYHMRHPNNPSLTKSFDLLYKGVEITTGAQREHRYDVLVKQAKEKGIQPKSIQFYLDFFRYGIPPHGGGALSHTRIIKQMLGLSNVREATFLPRDPERLSP